MTKKSPTPSPQDASKRRITMERTYKAPIEDVWDLWTTKEGIESWWGPEGFAVKVHKIDLRPGGELLYAMSAVDAPQIEFMKQAGMPTTTEARITFSEVVAQKRLSYLHLADFIPGVEPYDVATTVELHPSPGGVRMLLTFDAMHDELWTNRQAMGWESELGKLDKVLAARSA
jgi:uncharacterized protein YndB with AHSA1/START domain